MTARSEKLQQPEGEVNLIKDLQVLYDAVQKKHAEGNLDVAVVDPELPDPHDFKLPVLELLEVYFQMAQTEADNLKQSGKSLDVLSATKAQKGILADTEALILQLTPEEPAVESEMDEPEETEFEAHPIQQKFDRLPLYGETILFLSPLIGSTEDQGLIDFIAQILEQNKDVDSFDPKDFRGVDLVQYLTETLVSLYEIEETFPDTDPSEEPDPIAYRTQLRRFSNELSQRVAQLLQAFEEMIADVAVQEEVEAQEQQDTQRTTATLQIADIFATSGTIQIIERRQTARGDDVDLLDVQEDLVFKNEQIDVIKEKLQQDHMDEDHLQILKNTVVDVRSGAEQQEEELKVLSNFFKQQLKSRFNIELEESSISPEMLFLMSDKFRHNEEILKRVQHAKKLLAILRKKRVFISNLDTVIQELQRARAENPINQTEADKKKEEIVESIYTQLRKFAVPTYKEQYSLPDFDKFFELPATQAYDLLSTAIIVRIEKFYVDALSSGSTAFAYHKGSIDLWSDDHMFSVPLEGADDLTSFRYFIESFPWERFMPEARKTGPDAENNITDFRQKMIDLWKYRILHIQNASNAASGIENLWRDNEHGSYWTDVFSHIASRGDGGGLQAWDMGPYFHRIHDGEDNADQIYREAFGGAEEENWLLPEYENYLIFRVQQKYDDLQLNDLEGKVAQLTADLQPGTVRGRNTILQDLYDLVEAKYGPERLKKDKEKLDLAVKKAIWNLTYTLKLHEFDKGGIHSRLGRLMNIKAYYGKVFGTGVSGVKWRPTLGVSIERALPPIESFQTADIILSDPQTGDPIYEEVNLAQLYTEVVSGTHPNLEMYTKWLMDLKLQSLDAITDIKTEAHVRKLEKTQTRLKNESQIEDQAALRRVKTQVQSLLKKIKDEKFTEYDYNENKLLTEKGKAAQAEDKEKLAQLQERINLFEKSAEIAKLLAFLTKYGAQENPPANQPIKSIDRLATLYAVLSRYKIITIKPEYRGLNQPTTLPIAVPKSRLVTKNGEIRAKGVQVQAFRDAQLAARYIDLSTLPPKPNSALNAHFGEAKKWIDFVDLTDHDGIFTPIHTQDPQDKLRAIDSVFTEKNAVQKALLKLRINANEFLRKSADAQENGEKLDAFLRKKIWVVDIPLHEIVSDSEKPGEKPPGLGFVKVIQYAAKYLWGKTSNKALFLEMFREYHQEIDEIIVQGRKMSGDTQKKWFWARTKTPVADFVRTSVDQWLENQKKPKEKRTDRAESEFIVGLFWMAIGAYLDQYSYDKEIGQDMAIPLSKDQRANEIATVETISGIKPMDFADRQLFLAYVERTLQFFSEYWTGPNAPRNIANIGNVVDMMKARGIIGSKQQIWVDLHAYESGRYTALVKKSSDKK